MDRSIVEVLFSLQFSYNTYYILVPREVSLCDLVSESARHLSFPRVLFAQGVGTYSYHTLFLSTLLPLILITYQTYSTYLSTSMYLAAPSCQSCPDFAQVHLAFRQRLQYIGG